MESKQSKSKDQAREEETHEVGQADFHKIPEKPIIRWAKKMECPPSRYTEGGKLHSLQKKSKHHTLHTGPEPAPKWNEEGKGEGPD